MQATSKLSSRDTDAEGLLVCPACQGGLTSEGTLLVCTSCGREYPRVKGVPVAIVDERSVFSIEDFTSHKVTTLRPSTDALRVMLRKCTPRISSNLTAAGNLAEFAAQLKAQVARPRVLVIGGGIMGNGLRSITEDPAIEFVATDVSFGPYTEVVCDAHDLPFAAGAFDGVISQAVLEHVVDPVRCVAELHRVLKPNGWVYAETPFMQQVHMGRYDFCRYTPLGHRRLFRDFEEHRSGATAGPGVALAWAYKYFLLSFCTRRVTRLLMNSFAGWTSFWLKYVDRVLVRRAAALDATSGNFFLGQRREQPIDDRTILAGYRGAWDSSIGF